jgi:hypothetical protein
MKTLLKFATGAALAGVLVNRLLKKQTGRNSTFGRNSEGPLRSYDQNRSSSSAGMESTDDAGTAKSFEYGTPTQDLNRPQNRY